MRPDFAEHTAALGIDLDAAVFFRNGRIIAQGARGDLYVATEDGWRILRLPPRQRPKELKSAASRRKGYPLRRER